MVFSNRRRLIELASRHRLPVMGWVRELVDDGAALSYGPSNFDMQRRAAAYVARILHGAKPADLPVEQPAGFELVINRKVVAALGLPINPVLLHRADDIIEWSASTRYTVRALKSAHKREWPQRAAWIAFNNRRAAA